MIQAEQPDIIIGNASWLHDCHDDNIQSSEVLPADYNIYRKNHKSDAHGGVFILVSNKYLSSEPAELKCESEVELLWVKIQNKGIPDLHIGSFYKPPNMTDESIIQELDRSIYRVKQSPNSHIWLSGDFNLGGINWKNGSIRPRASNTKQCKQLLDISHDHALEQMVSKHTYITESSQSTLD